MNRAKDAPMAELMDPLAAAFRHEGTNGEAVVLIHGFTGAPSHFLLLADALNEAGYTVTVPRLAGHGTSIEDMATTNAADWIESARLAVDDVADHDRIHLVGLSMGGLISLLLARPCRAASVTTINSPVIVRDKKLYGAPVARFFVEKVEWADDGEPAFDSSLSHLWLPYHGFYTKNAGGLLWIGIRAVLAARRLRIPSLVIQSRTDEAVDPRSAGILKRLLGNGCELVWLEDSAHLSLLDGERDTITAAVLQRIDLG
jgi:carboxylesterase